MRKPALIVIWIVATFATTAIAYVAVNAAGAEVTDRPLTSVVAPDDTGSTSTSSTSTTSTSAGPGTITTNGTVTTAPATTVTAAPTTSTSLSVSTTSASPWQQATIPSKGGLVIVSYRPGEVRLESVAPSAGFSYRIEDQGPPDVRVEFEGGELRVEVRVRWDNGLVTEVDENR
jgi:hypothetical protein